MIKYFRVVDLPSDLYRKLSRLNESNSDTTSLMKHHLQMAREYKDNSAFVTVSITDNIVNGWCIVYRNLLQVYVRHSKRRRGFGTRLLNNALKYTTTKPEVIEAKAREFFNKLSAG